jgi:hypothetical protein
MGSSTIGNAVWVISGALWPFGLFGLFYWDVILRERKHRK